MRITNLVTGGVEFRDQVVQGKVDEKLIRDDEDELKNDDESRLNSLHPSLYDSRSVGQFKRNIDFHCLHINHCS